MNNTRINSGGVYKGVEAQSHYDVEFISDGRNTSRKVSLFIMFVVIPTLLVGVYFLLASM